MALASAFRSREARVVELPPAHRSHSGIAHSEMRPKAVTARRPRLIELGAVERIGKGRGNRYLLSRRLHAEIGEKGTYTRKNSLGRCFANGEATLDGRDQR